MFRHDKRAGRNTADRSHDPVVEQFARQVMPDELLDGRRRGVL